MTGAYGGAHREIVLRVVGRGSAWIARARVRLQHPVVAVGLGLVLLQAVYRGWAAAGGWFYGDDFELVEAAHRSGLTWRYLLSPHDSQFMPGGRLAAWLVSEAAPLAWWPAATQMVALQLLAGLAALAMLVTLFGARWLILVPLAFYLFTPMTISGYMWWASALNQLPMQAVTFLSVLLLVTWLRRRGRGWLLGLAATVTIGLLCYVKTLLVIGVLVAVAVLWPREDGDARAGGVLGRARSRLPAVVVLLVVAVAYLAYYTSRVPTPLSSGSPIDYGALFRTMFVTALPTTLVGGPWSWTPDNPPLGRVATPAWVGGILFGVLVLALALAIRRRVARAAPILVALAYLAVNFVLVARARAVYLGGGAGLELRYLADAAPVLCLCLGLAMMAPRSEEPAPPAASTPRPDRRRELAAAVVVVGLVASAAVSTTRYVGLWHADYPTRQFVTAVADQTRGARLVVADVPVPPSVVPVISAPANLPSRLLSTVPGFRAADAGNDLLVLDEAGTARQAAVAASASSTPGSAPGCGYRVDSGSTQTIELDGDAPPLWWAEIRYLADRDGEVELTLSGRTDTYRVLRGPHRLFVQGEGDPGRISLRTEGSTIMCVDQVLIGDLQPWEPL